MQGVRAPSSIQLESPRRKRLQDLPLILQLYVSAVITIAALLLAALSPDLLDRPEGLGIGLVMSALLVLAKHNDIHLGSGLKISTDTTVLFASALLFEPALAVSLVAVGSFASNALARRSWFGSLFNAAQASLSTAVAGFLYSTLAPGRLDQMGDLSGQLPALVCAGVGMYLCNALLVDTAAALQLGQHPLAGSWGRHRSVLPHHVALFLLGILPALTVRTHPWTLGLVAIPVAVIQIALRDMVRLRVQTREAVEALADMVDLRDPYTHGHSQRVSEYAARIAKKLGLSADEVEVIRAAARVHDIGKIAVPDRVLLKPDRLTEEEYREMQRHQEMGATLLERFPDFRAGREYVLYHHERTDGTGYGRGLKGGQIPLGAAVIAVADSFDAMTSNRPYRMALPIEEATGELRRHRGKQWDARVVDAFLEILDADTPRPLQQRLVVAGT